MKKIINGKKYDTETAKECGTAYSNCGCNDFNWWKETLYKKRTGEFFLYGEGNANSKYAERYGDTWCSGSEIVPLTVEKTKKWSERYLEVNEYEALFGEVEE